jgi:hypothetical protein
MGSEISRLQAGVTSQGTSLDDSQDLWLEVRRINSNVERLIEPIERLARDMETLVANAKLNAPTATEAEQPLLPPVVKVETCGVVEEISLANYGNFDFVWQGGSFAFAMFTLRAVHGRKGSLEPRTQSKINTIVDDVCSVFCRFLREQPKGLVPDEALIVNHFGSKDINFDWGRLLEDVHRLNFHEAPPTAHQKGSKLSQTRAPMDPAQTLKSLFESVTTLVFRCQYVEGPSEESSLYAKRIPPAAYSDRPVLMRPRFRRNPADKWILRLELFAIEGTDSPFDPY